jgi:hypothetical protein
MLSGHFRSRALDLLLLLLIRADRAYADLDLAGLGFGLLGQLELEHARIVGCLYVFGINGARQSEAAGEGAVAVLDAMEVFLLLFARPGYRGLPASRPGLRV